MVRLFPEILLKGTAEEVLYVLVPAAEWIPPNLPAINAKFSTCAWIDRNGADRYEDFVLLTYDHVRTQEGAFQRLIFGRDYTATNPDTNKPWDQTAFNVRGGEAKYTWPDVMREFEFTFDEKLRLASAYTDGTDAGQLLASRPFLDKNDIKRGGSYVSKLRIADFIRNTPLPAAAFEPDEPIPQVIPWDYAGHSGEVICLHTKKTIKARPTNYHSVINGVPASVTGAATTDRTYAATNYLDWETWHYSREQRQHESGLWIVTISLIEPPTVP